MNSKYNHIQCVTKNNFLHIIFNHQHSSVNILDAETLENLDYILSDVRRNQEIVGIIFESAKENCFIAGADINEIKTIQDSTDGTAKAQIGQNVINKISTLPIPSYAIINGACMGGGLELALACTMRIGIENPKTKLSLPEVNLGFIPGFGGTQRLPRIVGLSNSLDAILTGKLFDCKKAKKIKLIHTVCHINMVMSIIYETHKKIIHNKYLEKNAYKPSFIEKYLPNIVFFFARKKVINTTKGKYPAPLEAINVIQKTLNIPIKDGLAIEAKSFGILAASEISRNLVDLFFTSEALKKEYASSNKNTDIQNITTLGSGIMGGGIAFLFNNNGFNVRMKDIATESLTAGFKQIQSYYKNLINKKVISQKNADINLSKITSSINYNGIDFSDLIIEAVVEDISVKHKVLQEVETKISENCIIATNTSSLKVSDIASPLLRKQNVIGMHFFNPVNKMPLVEVVITPQTSKENAIKVMDLLRKCGKIAIPVGDCNGFVVNRVLMPFMNEALLCFEEYGSILQIDTILKEFGMPMGAFELADEIGIDVCYKVANILHSAYGERMKPSITLKKMYTQMNLLGKKGGAGFYKNNKPNKDITPQTNRNFSKEEIISRTMFIMINEACRILEEGHIKNPHYLDMCMIMGAGFPAFHGGILKYANSLGINHVHEKLEYLTKTYGDRFKPCTLITEFAKNNINFYEAFKL